MYASAYARVRRALPYAYQKYQQRRNVHRNAYALATQKKKKFAAVHRYIKRGVKLNQTRYRTANGKYRSTFGSAGSMFGTKKRYNVKKYNYWVKHR